MSLLPMSAPDQRVCYPPLCYPNFWITGPLLASFVLAGVGRLCRWCVPPLGVPRIWFVVRLWVVRNGGGWACIRGAEVDMMTLSNLALVGRQPCPDARKWHCVSQGAGYRLSANWGTCWTY